MPDQDQDSIPKALASVDRVFDSLGVPADEAAIERVRSAGADIGSQLDLLVTDEVAKRLWISWNPEQAHRFEETRFRKAFTHMLAEGVRLGFHVNRFRDMSRSLPDPVADGDNWAVLFEAAVAGQDRCKVRISFSPERYRAYMATNQDSEAEKSWDGMFSMMKDGLFYELGIVYPPIDVEADESLSGEELRVEWNDVRLPPYKSIGDGRVMVNDTVDRLKLLNITGEKAFNPANGSEFALIPIEYADLAEHSGLTVWDNQGYAILFISSVLRKAAGAFVNRYFVWYCLDALAQAWPLLVDQIKQRMNIDTLVRILRELVDEEISVRNLRAILEAILAAQSRIDEDLSRYIVFTNAASGAVFRSIYGENVMRVSDYVTHVRNAMKRYISHKYTRGESTLIVYLMEPEIEARMRNPRDLTVDEHEALFAAIRYEVGSLPATARNPVILTTQEIRARLRGEIVHEFPHLAVLSYQELSPDMNIQPIARITADDWPSEN